MCCKSTIQKKEFVGQGANWKVFHIECEPVMINGKCISQAVVKETKSYQDAEYYVSKYEAIAKYAVPTVSFCALASAYFEEYSDTNNSVVCEDLNLKFPKEFYVTANSVRKCTEPYPKCEGFLLENKFTEISNFDSFLKQSLDEISGFQNIYFDGDSIFFGVVMNGEGIITLKDYKVADLDFVGECKEDVPADLNSKLRLEFLFALEEFCKFFEAGEHYQRKVQSELENNRITDR